MAHGTAQTVATEFFQRLSNNDLEGAMSLISDDCAIWIAHASTSPGAQYEGATLTKMVFAEMMAKSQQLAPAGMQFTIHHSLAAGDTVALEVESRANLANDRLYNNRYTFWLTVAETQITGLREYFDTKYAEDFFLNLLDSHER